MDTVECPYCFEDVEINHDDGHGYEEDVNHEITCGLCKKTFMFNTYILYSYNSFKTDCLNEGGEHEYKITCTVPREFSKMECTMCGETRELTEAERIEHGLGSKKDYFDNLKK